MLVTITKLEYGHLDAVADLEKRSFSMPWSRQAFQDAVDSEHYEYIVAVCDEKVIGYAGMQTVLDEAEITNIAVDAEFHRLGVGKKLLDCLAELCREKRIAYIHLEVRESNEAARTLYENNGYEIDGIRKNFYQKPTENAVLMTKRI